MAEQNYIITSTAGGSVRIGEDVFVRLITSTVEELESVAGFSAAYSAELAELVGKRNLARGISLTTEEDGSIRIDVMLQVRYGYNVAQTAETVQETVRAAVEATTGIVCRVNVHVTGISFEKAETK